MAAITYWVDPASGSDAADGKSYANRIQTMTQLATNITADGNGNDYTINCLNTGDYLCTTNSLDVNIFNLTSATFAFRGVSDSSATPAFATVKASTTGSNYFMYIRGHTSCTYEYFDVDATADQGGSTTIYFACTGPNANGLRVQYCKFRGGSAATQTRSDTDVYAVHNIPGTTTGITDSWHLRYCLFENTTDLNMLSTSSVTNTTYVYENVIVFSGAADTYIPFNVIGGVSGWSFGFYKNTVYLYQATAAGQHGGSIRCTESTDNFNWDFYNNVFYLQSDQSVATPSVITGAGGSPSSSFTPITAIGYNLFLESSENAAGYVPDMYDGALPWDPDVTGPPLLYTGDVLTREAVEADYFNDPASTYDWTPTGSSLVITIPLDLRLIQETTSGLSGSTPGALPPASTTYTVTCAPTKRQYFKPRKATGVTVTVSNTGTSADSITLSVNPMAADLNYISANESQGTFTYNSVTKTGSWAVGTLASGATATLLIGYFAPFGVTDDQNFTATWTGGSIGASGGSTLTASATLIPLSGGTGGGVDDGGDPADNPASVPFIDTLPLQGDIHTLDVNLRLSTTRNRESEQYLRADIEGKRWSEARVMRVNVATNTATSINLGGIEQGHYLLVESDEPVMVSINGTAAADYIPQAKAVVLLDVEVEELAVKNTSTTASANVLIAVVD